MRRFPYCLAGLDKRPGRGRHFLFFFFHPRAGLENLRVFMSSRTVGWIQLATLLLLIAFWCSSPDYEILLQVTVCTAACAAALHSGEQHRYILATVFAGMALLFNPVVPIMLS